jgi:hypothetical protein
MVPGGSEGLDYLEVPVMDAKVRRRLGMAMNVVMAFVLVGLILVVVVIAAIYMIAIQG